MKRVLRAISSQYATALSVVLFTYRYVESNVSSAANRIFYLTPIVT